MDKKTSKSTKEHQLINQGSWVYSKRAYISQANRGKEMDTLSFQKKKKNSKENNSLRK